MANKKIARRAFISSVISLILCCTMLVGTTFAWFTDTVTSAGNIIKSGTLDVTMEWADGKEDPAAATWTDASKGAIFNSELWEPGYTEVVHVKIANVGTLALKYQLQIVANGDVSKLADVIDVYYSDPAKQIAERTALNDLEKLGTLTEVLGGISSTANGNLKAGESVTLTLALKMQEEAGNEYQNLAIGSDFSVILLATQETYEKDTFDDQYDADSKYPVLDNVAKEENKPAAVGTEGVQIDIPAAAPAGNYTIEVSNKNETTDAEGNTTVAMDIDLMKDGEKVTADGTTVYTVAINVGAGKTIVEATHNGQPIADYQYNPVTGIITFETDSFSPFAVKFADAPANSVATRVENGNAVYYETFQKALDAAQNGDTIALMDSVTVDADATINIANTLTLNLNGNTLAGVSDETGKNKSLIVVGKGGNLTVQNGIVTMEHKGANMGWNNSTNALEAVSGGQLNLENVTVKNLGGSDMAYGVNIGNNGGATLNTVNSTIESVNYVALRVFNNADGAINVDLTKGSKLTGMSSPFFVHFWSKTDLGNKMEARQAFLNVKFNDTEVTRYNGSKSLFRFGFDDAIYYSDSALSEVVAGNATALNWALQNGKNVLLNNDISDAPVNTVAPYGNYYGVAQKGGVLDGNSNTLDFDMGELKNGKADNYGIMISGGTIKNVTITGVFRGIMVMYPTETIYIDNVTVGDEDVCYSINTAEGDGTQDMVITNSTIKGWSSYGTAIKSVSFTNCTFEQGEYYTDVFGRIVKPYVNAVFENCEFNSKYYIDLSAFEGTQIVLKNCTVNGVALTAENWTSLIVAEVDCGEGQISIEAKDGTYMTASNPLDYVIIQ